MIHPAGASTTSAPAGDGGRGGGYHSRGRSLASSDRSCDAAASRGTSLTRNYTLTEDQEAEVLSRATSQAIIAARSILLSGGSQATALSTAKAAALSVLMPTTLGLENTNHLTAMGRQMINRRKAKRQADVVASMAYLSVKNAIQPQMTEQESHQIEASNFMMMRGVSYLSSGASATTTSVMGMTGATTVAAESQQSEPIIKKQLGTSIHSAAGIGATGGTQALSQSIPNFDMQGSTRSLPDQLPKSKQGMRRDQTGGVDPDRKYDNDVAPHSSGSFTSNSHTEDDSITYRSDDITEGNHTIDSGYPKKSTKDDAGFLTMEPLFSSLNLFLCGVAETSNESDRHNESRSERDHDIEDYDTEREPPISFSKKRHGRSRSGHQENSSGSGSDNHRRSSANDIVDSYRRDAGSTKPKKKTHIDLLRSQSNGHSTASSEDGIKLLQELDSTSDDGVSAPYEESKPKSALKSSIRDSVEEVVLRALSSAGMSKHSKSFDNVSSANTKPAPDYQPNDKLTIKLDDDGSNKQHTVHRSSNVSDTHDSDISSLTSPHKNVLYSLSQRIKFRRWIRGRQFKMDGKVAECEEEDDLHLHHNQQQLAIE